MSSTAAAAALLDPTSHLMSGYSNPAAYSGYSWTGVSTPTTWWPNDTSTQAAAAWLSGYGSVAAASSLTGAADPTAMAYNPYLTSAFGAISSPGRVGES